MITASSLSRLLNCPGSLALPLAETASKYADSGNEEHEDLAQQVREGTLPLSLARFVPRRPRPEVTLAFDVEKRTGRMVGEDLKRAYTVAPTEIVGTADVIGQDGGTVVVVDWKTGYREVEPAATNAQLHFYALAAMKALGLDKAIVRIVYTKTGAHDEAEIDLFDLAPFADQLERLHKREAPTGDVSTREGAWCRFCPVNKAKCPSKTSLLVQISNKGLTVVGDAELTQARARDAYRQVVAARQLVDDAEARLVQWVKENGAIDLGDGRAYGFYRRAGKARLDADVAVQAIVDLTGEKALEFAKLAVERKVTQAGIERAAKALHPKGYTGLKKRIVERIDELGGLDRSDEFPIGEHPIEKSAPPPEADVEEMDRLLAGATP